MSSQGSGRGGRSEGDRDRDHDNEASGDFNTYGELHEFMFQAVILIGILDAKGVKALFNACCIRTNRRCAESEKLANIQKVVLAINSKIKDFNMAIKTVTCEMTAKKYYTFVTTNGDPMAEFEMKFTTFELDMFMHCMDVILRKTDTFTVSKADCVRIALEKDTSSKKSNSLVLANSFVQKMLQELYFVECLSPILDGPGHITLGPRTMKEFECVLRESYQEAVIKCCLCFRPLLHGWRCPNKSVCKNVVHLLCYKNLKTHSVDCPGCQAPWIPMTRLIRRVKEIAEDQDTEVTHVEVQEAVGTDTDAEPRVASLKSLNVVSAVTRIRSSSGIKALANGELVQMKESSSGPNGTFKLPLVKPSRSKPILTAEMKNDRTEKGGIELQFECGVRDSSFPSLDLRTEHTNEVHSDIHEFPCKYCGHVFLSEINLYSHLVIHSDSAEEKPFKCRVCNDGFSKKKQLRKHLKCIHEEMAKANEEDVTIPKLRLMIFAALEFLLDDPRMCHDASYELTNRFVEEAFNVKTDCLNELNGMVREGILSLSEDGTYSKNSLHLYWSSEDIQVGPGDLGKVRKGNSESSRKGRRPITDEDCAVSKRMRSEFPSHLQNESRRDVRGELYNAYQTSQYKNQSPHQLIGLMYD